MSANPKLKNGADVNAVVDREAALVDALMELTGELIGPKVITQIEQAAVESDDGESDKPVKAKVSVSFTWAAGAQTVEVEAKSSFSTIHKAFADRVVDPAQMKMELEVDK